MVPPTYAIVPAAGLSSRMGQPKLLLPWGSSTIIETVLGAWRAARIEHIVVVTRPDVPELAERCRAAGAHVVVPDEAPPDMRMSVQLGIQYIDQTWSPAPQDVWLMAPADMPSLSAAVITGLLAAYDPRRPSVIVPVVAGRRGHPILLPWSASRLVPNLPVGQGIRYLLAQLPVQEFPTSDPGVRLDVDTPADYRRAIPRDTSPPRNEPLH